jgi:hypothetical protein
MYAACVRNRGVFGHALEHCRSSLYSNLVGVPGGSGLNDHIPSFRPGGSLHIRCHRQYAAGDGAGRHRDGGLLRPWPRRHLPTPGPASRMPVSARGVP